MEEVKYTLQKELLVVPKVVTSGVGDFCDQVILLLLEFIAIKLCAPGRSVVNVVVKELSHSNLLRSE